MMGIHRFANCTSPSLSTTSSSSPPSLTTSLTYFSALVVRVAHTGGRIWGSQPAICFGTFFTSTVRAFSTLDVCLHRIKKHETIQVYLQIYKFHKVPLFSGQHQRFVNLGHRGRQRAPPRTLTRLGSTKTSAATCSPARSGFSIQTKQRLGSPLPWCRSLM